MAVVFFPDEETAERWIADIEVTPDIEGGIGPVKVGLAAVSADGRWAVSHPYREVDLDWIEAYSVGTRVEIQDE